MRSVWLSVLLGVCLLAGGWILVQDRAGAGGAALAAPAAPEEGALDARPAAPDASTRESDDGAPTFYRYTDASGSVRFVTSLAQVPRELRTQARRVTENRVQRAAAGTPRAARRARPVRQAPERPAFAHNREVIVYTTSWCGWCRKTLRFLDENGIDYDNRDIEADDAWRDELEAKTGSSSVPVVEIDGQLVRGYDPARMRQLLQSS